MGDLSIQDLVVEYSSGGYALRPINGLSLDVPAGSLLILLGPSGCGKTTLLSCLGGILRPKSGAIKFDDVDVTALEGGALAKYRRDKVGIVFQFFHLMPTMSVLENICLPLLLRGDGLAAARSQAAEIIDLVGLSDRAKHGVHQLSGGQLQRTAIARALVHDPAVLLADEPTGNLDSANAAQIMALLQKISSQRRTTMLVVTHSEEVARQAARCIRLCDGKITDHP